MSGWLGTIRNITIAILVALAFLSSPAFPPALSQASETAPDAFTRCVKQGTGETDCLAQLGEQFDWRPTEGACLFLADKTEAIITAGGDVRYRDLFYNERCARLGLPHGRAAAAAGDNIDPNSPYMRCWNTIYLLDCDEEIGQHTRQLTKNGCYGPRSTIRDDQKNREPSNWWSLFDNERCWRLMLPHYDGQQ